MPLFSHMLDLARTLNFSQATLIKPIHNKKSHRLLEIAVIFKMKCISSSSPGFIRFLPTWQTLCYMKTISK